MRLLIKLLITALALIGIAYFLPGVTVTGPYIAIIVAIILGILNLVIRPILIILTLPISFLTLGLFTFVINGFLFWFVATFVEGFSVDSFLIAILGALIVSVISWLGEKILLHD